MINSITANVQSVAKKWGEGPMGGTYQALNLVWVSREGFLEETKAHTRWDSMQKAD